MASPFLTGIDGTVLFTTPSAAAKELAVVDWALRETAELVKFVNSLTGHFPINAATFIDNEFTITVDVDPANEAFSATVGAYVGETIGPVKLLYSKAGTTGYYYATAVIREASNRMERRGKIVQVLTCVGNGAPLRGDGSTTRYPAEAAWPAP